MATSTRRVQKELQKLRREQVEGVEVEPETDDPNQWIVKLSGAENTIYAGESYKLRVRFSNRYPIEAPEVVFMPGFVPMHPHIYSNGHICLSILYDEWSPALTVQSVCLSILSMMSSCEKKELPEDNATYVARIQHKSPKETQWAFHDDTV